MVNIKLRSGNSMPPLLHLTYELQQLSDKNLSKTGLGLGQVRILGGLHSSVPRSQKELAMLLRQTEANVSRQLQTLKRQKLVNVIKNKKDSRQRDVKLTVRGSQKYKSAIKVLNEQQSDLMKRTGSKDRQSFERVTEQILTQAK